MKDVRTQPAVEQASASPQYQTHPAPHILVVEDDVDIRRHVAKTLIGSGYHVDDVEDGAAAWDALDLKYYDLLVTDNNMPKVTGVELLKMLHADGRALPVIMATGLLPTEEFARHPWIQPAVVLLKPCSGTDILQAVQKVLSTNREPEFSSMPVASIPSWSVG